MLLDGRSVSDSRRSDRSIAPNRCRYDALTRWRMPLTLPCCWPLHWAVLPRGCIFPSVAVKSWSETTNMPRREGM